MVKSDQCIAELLMCTVAAGQSAGLHAVAPVALKLSNPHLNALLLLIGCAVFLLELVSVRVMVLSVCTILMTIW